MLEPHPILDSLRLGLEILAALVGLIYLPKLRNSHWKWFSVYLVFMVLQEVFWSGRFTFLGLHRSYYFAYFGIPVQYLFFYWLYALKSLKKRNLFFLFSLIYLANLPMALFFEETDTLYSINISIGTTLLFILVILEFLQQIRNEDILQFWKNKMFYINVGVLPFYVGSFPFQTLYEYFEENLPQFLNGYYVYFLIAMCFMYLSFTASFIWGKQK
ncbi:hypothetical protein POV27_06835 [Aureisphaera galaxeae]|uniref:hypothetical protein n=1 Tax=Aureisphaera galaxeae TaxID=1538023 RepID=UPI002350D352|nr:hypothetical protein [Aureisphaera galaxeae]MDC8003759.1 hypothetical protein [Aureisphaera galaxeae]